MITKQQVHEHIIKEEGFRNQAYRDHLGNWTIGVGHLLSRNKEADYSNVYWSDEKVRAQLNLDANIAMGDANYLVKHLYTSHPEEVQLTIIDMAYQLGYSRLNKFKRMLHHINNYNYNEAANELLDSLYAKQTPRRANRNAARLRQAHNAQTKYGGVYS